MYLESNERELTDGTILRMDSYYGYDFATNSGNVIYSICDYKEVVGYDSEGQFILRFDNTDQFFTAKNVLKSDSVALELGVVQNWGSSDQPIFDYVASKLNVTLK